MIHPPGAPRASGSPQVAGLVDHLFRHEFGRMVATLTRILGPAHLERAEDLAQEALLRALRLWPVRGVPERPAAWLQRVAQNLALDAIRHDALSREKVEELRRWTREEQAGASSPDTAVEESPQDDTLRMLLLCCHEALPRESRLALTLKTVAGFGVEEIARALLVRPSAVAQRLVRAKRRLREPDVDFTLPEGEALERRLDTALDVLYLLFNEGYESSQGQSLIRRDLVLEALRLAALLQEEPRCAGPVVHALQALMEFQASRLDARVGDAGELLLLEDQDRSRWDRARIARGMAHLQRAMAAPRLHRFHLEAGIASCHAVAPTLEDTDWAQIFSFYEQLLALAPSPVVRLNRAVARGMVHGPVEALRELEELATEPALRDYPLLDAVRGEFLRRSGQEAEARCCFERAAEATASVPVRDLLRRKLSGFGGRSGD